MKLFDWLKKQPVHKSYYEGQCEIDEKLEIYKQKKLLEIREDLVHNLEDNAKSKGTAEHEYHSDQEAKGIEIAKLDAKIEVLKQFEKETQEAKQQNKELVDKLMAMLDKFVSTVNDSKHCSCKQQTT